MESVDSGNWGKKMKGRSGKTAILEIYSALHHVPMLVRENKVKVCRQTFWQNSKLNLESPTYHNSKIHFFALVPNKMKEPRGFNTLKGKCEQKLQQNWYIFLLVQKKRQTLCPEIYSK